MSTTVAPQSQPLSGSKMLAYIIRGAQARGLDPRAVIAVARSEGLSGAIGDGGHAFGPFQLNDAGGVITGKFPGRSALELQAWASSPAGLDYALDGIAKTASGLTGQSAIHAIVYGFEHPKDPAAEVSRASGYYGETPPGLFGDQSILGDAGAAASAAAGGVNSAARHVPGVAQVEDAVSGAYDGLKSIGEFVGKITSLSFALRAGEVIAGAFMVAVGVILLARQVGLAPSPSTLAAAAAVV